MTMIPLPIPAGGRRTWIWPVLGALLLLPPSAEIMQVAAASKTFTVNTTLDTLNGCDVAECTLREAITAANAHPGKDKIAFTSPGMARTSSPHWVTCRRSGTP